MNLKGAVIDSDTVESIPQTTMRKELNSSVVTLIVSEAGRFKSVCLMAKGHYDRNNIDEE